MKAMILALDINQTLICRHHTAIIVRSDALHTSNDARPL
jgi:hypothetical protein